MKLLNKVNRNLVLKRQGQSNFLEDRNKDINYKFLKHSKDFTKKRVEDVNYMLNNHSVYRDKNKRKTYL